MIVEMFTLIIRNTATSKMWSLTPCNTCSSSTVDEPLPSHHRGSSQPRAKRSDWFISIAKPWHILLYENPPFYGCCGIEHGMAVSSPCASRCAVVRISLGKLLPEVLCKAASSVNNSSSTAASFHHGYCQLPANGLPLLLGFRASRSSW